MVLFCAYRSSAVRLGVKPCSRIASEGFDVFRDFAELARCRLGSTKREYLSLANVG